MPLESKDNYKTLYSKGGDKIMTDKIIHNTNCKRVFKRYDPTCPRCKELINGAIPRKAWFTPRENIRESFTPCNHGSYNINPGGYCNICGSGRDFS